MWNKIKNLFKKEEVKVIIPKPKMDFGDVHFELNIKSIIYYEKLTGSSFYKFNEENLLELIYSIFIVNNPDKSMTFEVFSLLLQREDVAVYFLRKFSECSEAIKDLSYGSEKHSTDNADTIENTITDYVMTLIIEYGVDANYVMYKMAIWELMPMFEAVESKVKKDMINQRFWTYMNVVPHIDTKKCKSPEKFIPFEWEKGDKMKNREDELNKHMSISKNIFGRDIFGNTINDDDNT